jgi:hypothetical protein
LPESDLSEKRKKAEQGDTVAQIDLGRLYWEKWDEQYGWCSENPGANFELLDEGARWLQKACEQKNSRACMMLCELELDRIDHIPFYGDIGAEREEAALRWYARARELGHPHNPSTLGLHREPIKDFGLNYSEEDANHWDLQYAKAGSTREQWKVACASSDCVTAYAWSYVAANSQRRHPIFEDPIKRERQRAAAVCRRFERVSTDDEMKKAHKMATTYLDDYGHRHVLKSWRVGIAHWVFDSRRAIQQECYWYLLMQILLFMASPIIWGSRLIELWRYRRSSE